MEPVFTPPILVPTGKATDPLAVAEIELSVPKYIVESDIYNDLVCISLNPRAKEPIFTFV